MCQYLRSCSASLSSIFVHNIIALSTRAAVALSSRWFARFLAVVNISKSARLSAMASLAMRINVIRSMSPDPACRTSNVTSDPAISHPNSAVETVSPCQMSKNRHL